MVPSRFGPVDKSKKTAETHSGSSSFFAFVNRSLILPYPEIACPQRDGSFAALKDFNDQCIENQAAEI